MLARLISWNEQNKIRTKFRDFAIESKSLA